MTSASPSPLPETESKVSFKDDIYLKERSKSPKHHSEEPELETSEQEKPTETSSASPDAQPEAGSSTSTSTSPAPPVVTNAHTQGDWQAIWSPQHNAYYFYNSRTHETTWTNPLADSPNASGSGSFPTSVASSSSRAAVEAAALAAGIDPELAFLDPTLVAGPSTSAAFTYTAKFNARTGAFAKPDARNPEHVSEYERMKRMSSFYFDMDEWQQDVEKRHEEEAESGKKRKKPTKKDLDSFKERKKQKKLAKTAWLRS